MIRDAVERAETPPVVSDADLLRMRAAMEAAILGMGAAAGVLTWVTWQWTERGR